MPKPQLASRTFGRGSAAKQDARRKAHTAEGATKLAELKARQEGTTVEAQLPRAACIQYLQAHGAYSGHSRDSVDQLRAAVAAHKAAQQPEPDTEPTVPAVVPEPAESQPTTRPRAARRPAIAEDATEATCAGTCGRTLPIRRFPTIGNGRRGSECRECRDSRLGRGTDPVTVTEQAEAAS